jgi:manganese transport protein
VVLSFGIPFALVPLVVLTSQAAIMGRHVNRRLTTICGCACVAVIIALNALILFQHLAAA